MSALRTDELRRRYASERDKRLRPDGNDQYVRLTGPFAQLLDGDVRIVDKAGGFGQAGQAGQDRN